MADKFYDWEARRVSVVPVVPDYRFVPVMHGTLVYVDGRRVCLVPKNLTLAQYFSLRMDDALLLTRIGMDDALLPALHEAGYINTELSYLRPLVAAGVDCGT